MEVAFFLMLPLATIVTATWIIVAAAFGAEPSFRGPFLACLAVPVLVTQPWHIASWQAAGMTAGLLLVSGISIAIGCLTGGIPAVLIVAVAKKMMRS